MHPTRFPDLVRTIYRVVAELEEMGPGRHFTPDGHMVGSLGEAIASHYYGVRLHPASSEGHDGEVDGYQVQIKATQRESIAITSEPDQLLVLQLTPDGSFTEQYNGPGEPVWSLVSLKPRPKNGHYQVRLSHLRKLMKLVSDDERLKRVVV